MHKSKIEKRQPEPQHSKEQKADGISVVSLRPSTYWLQYDVDLASRIKNSNAE